MEIESDRLWRALLGVVQDSNSCLRTGRECRNPCQCACWLEAQAEIPGAIQSEPVDTVTAWTISGSHWELTADEMELALVLGDKRLGGIQVWTDNKTGELAWWTGAVVDPTGRKNVELRDIFDTEDAAKNAVIRELVSTRPQLVASPSPISETSDA